jgi:hypothetical protein
MISVHNGEFWADGFRGRAPAAAGGLVLRRRGRRAVDQPAAGWAAAVSVRRMPRRRWHHVPADPRACRQARAQAQRQRDPGAPLPHNTARRAFTALMLDELTRRAAGQLGGRRILAPGDEQDLHAEPAIRRALDVLWPELTPEQLLALRTPNRGGSTLPRTNASPWPGQPARSRGPPPTCRCWTSSPSCWRHRRGRAAGGQRRAEQEAERAEAIQYATQVVDDLRQAGAIARPDVGVRRGAGWPGRHDKYVDPPD